MVGNLGSEKYVCARWLGNMDLEKRLMFVYVCVCVCACLIK